MMCHSMDILIANTRLLNPGQPAVIEIDQPRFAIGKYIQWAFPEKYEEDKVILMFGGLHIEMAAFRVVGDWLQKSGWTNVLVNADVASPGKADSFLKSSQVTRTRYAHQVTAASLHMLMKQAYEDDLKASEQEEDFYSWCERRRNESPQFEFWATTLELELTVFAFIRSLREGNFQLYLENLEKLIPCFLL